MGNAHFSDGAGLVKHKFLYNPDLLYEIAKESGS
jgi:hypothetical protein